MSNATLTAPLLTTATTEEEAANFLAVGKVTPAQFVTWLQGRNGSTGKAWHPKPPRMKVSDPKRCIHFGGCHNAQFGLTLYVSTVEYLLDNEKGIREWIKANNDKLARK